MSARCRLVFVFLICSLFQTRQCKKSDDNEFTESSSKDETKFRMHKLNLLWEKAQKKLNSAKLKSLYQDLKQQDKDEISLKRIRAAGKDKDGSVESETRRKFAAILRRYDLQHDMKVLADDSTNSENELRRQRVFKDKKLDKLWAKVERSGLHETEMKLLKEEFDHHQAKIDEYYEVVNSQNLDPDGFKNRNDHENSLNDVLYGVEEGRDFVMTTPFSVDASSNVHKAEDFVRFKHSELKANFGALSDRLHSMLGAKAFANPRVNKLWAMAKNASFTPEELESIRQELEHFEHRIGKLHHLQSDLEHKREVKMKDSSIDRITEEEKTLVNKVKKFAKKVEKVHDHIAGKILQRHIEL